MKSHIFQFFMAGLFTYQSFYFYISDFSSNYNPKWSLPEASQLQHMCWEKCDIDIVASNYWHWFVWQWYAVTYSPPSVTVHDLNWNVRQACKNLCTIGILSNKDSWFLVVIYTAIVCGITTACLNGHSVLYMECSVLCLNPCIIYEMLGA